MTCPARPTRSCRADPTTATPRRGRAEEITTRHPTPTTTEGLRTRARRLAARCRTRPTLRVMLRRLALALALGCVLLVVFAAPAFAQGGGTAPSLSGVINNLRNWIVGILAGVATLFLTIGGLRYLTAGGDPGQVEKAKVALKSAAVGYALAILAPLLVSILASIVG